MALVTPVKGVPLNQSFVRIDVEGNRHIFIENSSGSMVHIWPEKGISRTVISRATSLEYFYAHYSHVSNCYYFWNQDGYDLIEYDPITGETKYYEMWNTAGIPYSFQGQFHARYYPLPFVTLPSTDGHIYVGLYLSGNVYGYMRFNVLTKTFDEHSAIPDREFYHIHVKTDIDAFYLADVGTLNGVYSRYLHAPASDNYVHLRDTILAEIASAGLTTTDTGIMWLHYADRALSSPTRRILYNINGGTKYIDIKSPATWINSPANTNQAGTPVTTTNWISGVKFYALAVQAGVTAPTLSVGLAYSTPCKVGRFVYVGFNYLGDKTHFYTFAIHPITKVALYPPPSFDKNSDFLHNPGSGGVYKCNFGGLFGYSSSDELVLFLRGNRTGLYYFLRADNYEFQEYNPITNSSGYVIRAVNLNSPTDPDGLGYYFTPRFTNSVVETINGQDYYVDNNFGPNPALNLEFRQVNNGGFLSDVTYKFLPDKTKPTEELEVTIKDLFANPFTLSQAITLNTNKLVCIGITYSGASAINLVDANTFNLQKYLSDFISPNGAIRVNSNLIYVYGYSGAGHLIDTTNWNDIKKYDTPNGDTNEVTYATARPEGVLMLGQPTRSANHHSGASWNLLNTTTRTVTSLNSRFPNEFDFSSAVTLRNTTGMPNASYSDAEVETKIQAYMLATGKSRATVISEFLDTCRWHIADAYTVGNKTYAGLAYKSVLGLHGIRIEQTVGSGIWVDRHYYQNEGGKALLIDTANIANVQPSEIKSVQFNLTPNVQSMGRIAVGSNHIAFIVNDHPNSKGIIRVVTKAAFESAASTGTPITSLARTVEVNVNSTGEFGFGDTVDFDHHSTHRSNAYITVGDDLYITLVSNVNEGGGLYPCVVKVNLATGSVSTFAKSSARYARCISFLDDGTVERVLITNNTDVIVVDNFKSQVGSITI
jgi:hypothetical protein